MTSPLPLPSTVLTSQSIPADVVVNDARLANYLADNAAVGADLDAARSSAKRSKSIHPSERGEGGHSDSRTAKEKTWQRRRLRNTREEEMAETGRTNIQCESQTHETKEEGEYSEAELECSPQYDECGDLEPAAPVAVGKPERKFSGRALTVKMESASATNRPAGIRAGDKVRQDPRVIPEEGPGIRAGHRQKARQKDEIECRAKRHRVRLNGDHRVRNSIVI
ncbi:hypothetical protein DFH07DRAFT_986009 [Mycena maculata]|uniref:Uncharacterized protein n=1 Tax=Mycena maculata TaxID=230809 RepID=A0AAD7I722_9AGAR|nr:hypothetical protein DFH07DRAFT_986009 [Mycena maculata]